MSDNKKQSTPLTASEINKEVNEVKEGINTLEDKANKLAELVGSNISFAPWENKDLNIAEKPAIDISKALEEEKAKREAELAEKAKEAEEAARIAEEEARKAKEAEEAARVEEIKVEEVQESVQEVKEEPKKEEVVEVKKEEIKEVKKPIQKKTHERKPQQNQRPQQQNKVSFTGYYEKVVGVKKISKTTKGGRHMRFSALVIIGDKNGIVGYGKGKSIEVPVAIRKALKNAKNNLRKVKINKNGTLFHEVVGKQGAGKVLIKPAPIGTGIIAGGPIRVVLELAGYKDVYSKNLGKNTSMNMVLATLNGLSQIRSPKEIAYLRDKNLKDL